MRSSLTAFSLVLVLCAGAQDQPTVVRFTRLPDTIEVFSNGRGAMQWSHQNTVDIPRGTKTTRQDAYFRFWWLQFQPIDGKEGTYDWTAFDEQVRDAIDHRQAFSFGIMPFYTGTAKSVDGHPASFPGWLHTKMQAEPVKDWVSPLSSHWVQNWNSPSYIKAWGGLWRALGEHVNASSYKGVPFRNIIDHIDARCYGDFGEGHSLEIANTYKDFPAGTFITAESHISLMDSIIHNFPDHRITVMVSVFDGQQLQNTWTDPAVGAHALTVSNRAGKLGWRRDAWGWTDEYYSRWSDKNTTVYKGMRFDTAIMNRFRQAPVSGEMADLGNAASFDHLPGQVRTYHISSFGNGNLDKSVGDAKAFDNIRTASRLAGYCIAPSVFGYDAFRAGADVHVSMAWQNLGVAPPYLGWEVEYQLRKQGTTAWSAKSRFRPTLFAPTAKPKVVTETFSLPANLAPGDYQLVVIVNDPTRYRRPMALAIKGRLADGAYPISTVKVMAKN